MTSVRFSCHSSSAYPAGWSPHSRLVAEKGCRGASHQLAISRPPDASHLQAKCTPWVGRTFPLVVIQEAGVDATALKATRWIQLRSRLPDDADGQRPTASTVKPWFARCFAYKRGEPRVCAMVRPPTPEEEDRAQICRERRSLTADRVEHVNRIKGPLFSQGITNHERFGEIHANLVCSKCGRREPRLRQADLRFSIARQGKSLNELTPMSVGLSPRSASSDLPVSGSKHR